MYKAPKPYKTSGPQGSPEKLSGALTPAPSPKPIVVELGEGPGSRPPCKGSWLLWSCMFSLPARQSPTEEGHRSPCPPAHPLQGTESLDAISTAGTTMRKAAVSPPCRPRSCPTAPEVGQATF